LLANLKFAGKNKSQHKSKMKNKHLEIMVVTAAALCTSVISGKAQGFGNLNFEAGFGSPISGNYPPFYTLPDWNVNITGDQNGAAPGGVFDGSSIDNLTLDATYGYIVPPQGAFDVIAGGTMFPLDGNFSLALYVTGFPAPASISISQTATIPIGQNSVSFLLGYFGTFNLPPSQNPLNHFSLSINSQVVTSENGQILTIAGDISQWAGQQVTLAIANSISGEGTESFGVVDDVAFSPQVFAVPEPSVMQLLGAAIAMSVVFVNKRKAS
jgi:hypothetical protein